MKVIGFAGLKRSGKDSATNTVVAHYPARRVAFADPIKIGLYAMLQGAGVTYNDLVDDDKKEVPIPQIGRTPRYCFQTLGTEWGRQLISPTLWIDIAKRTVEEAHRLNQHAVISDIRFEDEAQAVRDMGGTVVHIVRPSDSAPDEHASEKGLFVAKGDYCILNDSTLHVFREHVLATVESIIE